ncbi:hypothetical protein F2Q69_00000781 [Brassica cretica]|uniref:Uncharacterized protein n=1 Tax=Brassica cretica TaxID=69181 RepID=A0A8S9PHW3_BRACR|nr:hypothetical protein F2Q69_00000781 [Brassica cretica]
MESRTRVVDNSGRRLSSRRRRSCRRLRPWRRHVSLDNNPFNRRICVAVAASLLFIRCRNRNELGRYIVVVTRIYRTANAVIRVRRLRSSLRRSASSSATASSLPTPRSVALRVLPLPARSRLFCSRHCSESDGTLRRRAAADESAARLLLPLLRLPHRLCLCRRSCRSRSSSWIQNTSWFSPPRRSCSGLVFRTRSVSRLHRLESGL